MEFKAQHLALSLSRSTVKVLRYSQNYFVLPAAYLHSFHSRHSVMSEARRIVRPMHHLMLLLLLIFSVALGQRLQHGLLDWSKII
jgi:hypothetical protein